MTLWSCRQTSRTIARGERKVLAWLHLLYCRHCRRFRREMEALGQAAGLWAASLIDPARRESFESRLIGHLTGSGDV